MKEAKTLKKAAAQKMSHVPVAHGVGRRKSSVARVWLRRGEGKITVNTKSYESYFQTDVARLAAAKPLEVLSVRGEYDVEVNISGGGIHGQADAMQLALARALVAHDEDRRATLREHELLTSDSRVKERKKYGQPGARRKFQFVKR